MEPLSSILFSLYRGQPAHREWIVACLEGAWPAIVGNALAGKCRPVTFDQGILTVEITDEAWDTPLREMSDELQSRLTKATAGEVRRLVLSSSPKITDP